MGLLIHVGAFKGTSALSRLPVDATVLAALIVLVLAVVVFAKDPSRSLHVVWPLLALWAVFLIGVPFVGSTTYAHQKVVLLFTLSAGIALISAFASDRPGFLSGLLWSQVAAGTLMAALLKLYGSHGDVDARLLLDGSNSIGAARVVGAAIVILVFLAFTSKLRLLVHGAVVLGLSAVLLDIGSRGPILFAALSALVAARLARWSRVRQPLRPGLVVLLVGGALFAILLHVQSPRLPLARVMLPLTEDLSADQSIGARLSLIEVSFSLIARHPFGVGLGNFAPFARAEGLPVYLRHSYPHNVLLEAGVEAGIAGMVTLVLVFGRALRGLRTMSRTAPWAASFALGLYFVGNALVSGDLTSNRPMWCFVGLGVGCWVQSSQALEQATPTLPQGARDLSRAPWLSARWHSVDGLGNACANRAVEITHPGARHGGRGRLRPDEPQT